MPEPRSDLLLGTLDLLVLKLLAVESTHGWGLAEQLETISGGVFCVNQGSLYPALQRLKRRGLVTSSWKTTANGRRARYYALTTKGRKQLVAELAAWARTSGGVNRVIAFASES